MGRKKKENLSLVFEEESAKVLGELLANPKTPETVRLSIINELNEAAKEETFFETMFNELVSLGFCPHCNHKNHWLIPEDELSQMGWISSQKDVRVKRHTDSKDCPEYAESCSKKKISA